MRERFGQPVVIAALISVLLWSSAFVAIRYVGRQLGPGELALARLKLSGDGWPAGAAPDNGNWIVARVCSEYLQHCERGLANASISKTDATHETILPADPRMSPPPRSASPPTRRRARHRCEAWRR